MSDTKIKLVIIDENTLGYIFPETPHQAGILHTMITKGSYYNKWQPIQLRWAKTIRLASAKDFDDYNHSFEGYNTDPNYEYQK